MNPKKVNDAAAAIYTVWLSVLAVLKIEFARTVALALVSVFEHACLSCTICSDFSSALTRMIETI